MAFRSPCNSSILQRYPAGITEMSHECALENCIQSHWNAVVQNFYTKCQKRRDFNKIILLILAIICSTTEVSCWWQVRQWKKNITEAVPLGKKSPVLLLLALAVSIIPHALILPFATNIMLLSAQDQTPGKPAELLVQEELHQTEPTAVKAGVQLLIQPVFCQPAATWGWAQWQPLGFLLLRQQETSLQGS